MSYQHITDSCFDDRLNGHGADRKRVDALVAQLSPALDALKTRQNKAAAPLIDLPSRTDDLASIEALAAKIRSGCETVVVAGTGGSGLSGRALMGLVKLGSKPNLHFLENIDPDGMDEVLAHIDCNKTCFLIISKSGSTAETLAQYFVLWDYATGKLGKKTAERFFIITLPGNNPLRREAKTHGMTVLDHDTIGGRFSILTNVGLLPAAIAGLDIRGLRRGAQTLVDHMDNAVLGAALSVAMSEKYPMNVLLPYGERLAGFSSWWRQGWAESLGKNGKGTTPITAMGTTDQHSQLQLYLDGPRDKFFTMIMLKRAGKGGRVAKNLEGELAYLSGKTLGDIMEAEQKATFETLINKGCPVRLITLAVLNEESFGALLMHFTIEIILAAALLGVNPFDQPAVEEGKILAREYLLAGKQ